MMLHFSFFYMSNVYILYIQIYSYFNSNMKYLMTLLYDYLDQLFLICMVVQIVQQIFTTFVLFGMLLFMLYLKAVCSNVFALLL